MDGRTLAQQRVGETLAEKYTLDRLLGAGGMGAVYAATNTWTRRKVAVKVLHPALDVDPEFVARFVREAQAASALRHPNIIEVLDLGRDPSGMPFIVQELLDGQDLRHRIEEGGALTGREAVELIVPILGALVCAHEAGIVHRDIKPDNIFLCALSDGSVEPKLIDFGVAKVRSDSGPALTAAGAIVGTPAYMAPEQVSGASEVDARADLWAIGAVLFEALAGRPPFLGATSQEVMIYVATQRPPAIQSVAPHVAHDLATVIDRALEPAPDKRTPSAAAMLSALLACREVLSRDDEAKLVARHHSSLSTYLRQSRGAEREPLAGASDTVHAPASQQATPPATRRSDAVSAARAARAPEPSNSEPAPPRPTAPARSVAPLAAIAVVTLGAGAIIAALATRGDPARARQSENETRDAAAPAVVERAPPPVVAPRPESPRDPRWRRVRGARSSAPTLLGVSEHAPSAQLGFRPSRRVSAPTYDFEIMRREVTWGELDPWLDAHPSLRFERPAAVAEQPSARAALAASGVPWPVADAYCRSLGARLPSEQEWEWAARGAALRAFPWGDAPIDSSRTNALRGPGASVQAPATNAQDCTPDPPELALCDLLGNAREWTADLFREDTPGTDERWTQHESTTYRALRGLSPTATRTTVTLQQTLAYRVALCATPPCPPRMHSTLTDVGFRCARPAPADDR